MTVPVHHHMPECNSFALFARQQPKYSIKTILSDAFFSLVTILSAFFHCVSSNSVRYSLSFYFHGNAMHSSSHRIQNETPNIEKLKHQSKYEKKATSQQNADSFPLCLAFPYWHIVHIFSLCKYYILGDYAGQTHNLAHSHNVSGAEEMLCI